jgi:hypothetical protein
MDISGFKPGERIIDIVSPGRDASPLGIKVSLISINDDRMKKLKKKIIDRRLYLEARGKSFKADELDENANEIAFSAMTGWQWSDGATFHGNVPGFTQREVFAVFDELSWFRNQIDEAIMEEKDFFTQSASS